MKRAARLLYIFYNTAAIVLFLFCAGISKVYCQLSSSRFITYTLPDGLPDNNVTAITADKYGYTWIGTENGLARFDGKYFTEFSGSENMQPLPSPEILSFVKLSTDQIGVVTRHGLNVIDVSNMTARNLMIPPRKGETEYMVNKLRKVLLGEDGSIYIISWSGFYHFNKKRELVFRYDDYEINQANSRGFGVLSLQLDKNHLLITGQKNYYVYNTSSRTLKEAEQYQKAYLTIALLYKHKQSNDLHLFQSGKQILAVPYNTDSLIYINEQIRQIRYSKIPVDSAKNFFTWRSNLFKVNDSTIWISGKFAGLHALKLNPETGALKLDTNISFKDLKCNELFIDVHNKYWIGFKGGLKLQTFNAGSLEQNPEAGFYEPVSLRNPVTQVAVTNRYLYGAAPYSGGAYRFKKESLEFDKIIPFAFPPAGNKTIYAAQYWKGDSILFGTDCGLFLYNEKTENAKFVEIPGWDIRHNWVSYLFIDSKKNAWIFSNKSRGCYVWKNGSARPEWLGLENDLPEQMTSIFHVAEGRDGNLWFTGNGLVRYNTRRQKIDLSFDSITRNMGSRNVAAITTDQSGNLWFCKENTGLVFLNTGTGRSKIFTKKDGLPDYKPSDVYFHDQYIWVLCKNGIAKINTVTQALTLVYTIRDLFYKQIAADKLSFDHLTGKFYTGAGSSVIGFQPAEFEKSPQPPRLLIVFAKAANEATVWFPQQPLQVNWKSKNVTLFVNAINYNDAFYQRYSYRLINGNSSDWINLDEQRRISLTGLKKGVTTVEIKVHSAQNAWPPQIITYKIKVVPPFWQTSWFKIICFIVTGFTLYAVYKFRSRQKNRLTAIRENISKDLHDEIGTTLSGIAMYSHMVKNSLEKNNNDMAIQSAGIIQESSTEMVNKLNDIVWLIKPQNETMAALIERLKIYAADVCAARNIVPDIQISSAAADCAPALDKRRNIYLICKEAINNAVKYSGATELLIGFTIVERWLQVVIKDNGRGFDPDNIRNGNGLANMRNRAEQIAAEFNIITGPGKGCTVQMQLKITQRGIV